MTSLFPSPSPGLKLKPVLRDWLVLALMQLAFVMCVSAQTALPPASPLVDGDAFAAFSLRTEPHATDSVRLETVDVTGPGFARAWRINTLRDTTPMAAIELRALTNRAVVTDDVAYLKFFARTLSATDESGVGRMFIMIRRNGVDFNSSFELGVTFGREWKEYVLPFKFHKDFAAAECAVMLRFGFKQQVVEVGGVELGYYGKIVTFDSLPRTRFTYAGREAGAAWREEALARIERIRKSDFTLAVTDAQGRPVVGATIKIEQQRSAFHWGSALQFARLVHDTSENLIYRGKVLELFNAASPENDLKWVTWAGDWGPEYSPAQSLAGLRWLRAHGFHSRGHVLVWPGWKNLPQYVQKLRGTPDEKDIPGLIDGHIREFATATKGLLDEWDALNEPFTNHDLMDIFGPEIMAGWFKTGREVMPGLPQYFNDFSNHDLTTDRSHVLHFEETTKFLLEHGAPVGGLGLQAHIASEPNAPAEILKVLDRYAAFKLPIRVTEFDVWTTDEELQADYTRDFFIALFSHPSVVGIQLWGFWEKAHWRPVAAMYRADWSEKPNAKVYRSLVLDQWRTRLAGTIGTAGRYQARGFHGDYVVTVEASGKSSTQPFTLSPGTSALTIQIKLP